MVMGAASSVNVRYMGGKKLLRFYHEDLFPTVGEMFATLHVPESLGFAMFRVFVQLDTSECGFIEQDACYAHFHGRQSKFTERIFHCHVVDGDKIRTAFTYQEFFLAAWSYCSLTVEGLARYIFEIFDVDKEDTLLRGHVSTMFRMLYDVDDVEEDYVNIYEYTSKQEISKSTFISSSRKNPALIKPAVQYQTFLRRRLGGRRPWEALCSYRSKAFMIYDTTSDTLAEAVQTILHASEEFYESKRPTTSEGLLRASTHRLQVDVDMISKELKMREQQLAHEKKLAASQDRSRPMRRAWALFEAKKQAFLDEEYLTDQIWKRHEDREEIYKVLDKAIEISTEYYNWKDQHDLNIAEGTDVDHEARYQDFLLTDAGKALHKILYLLRTFQSIEVQILEKLAKARRKQTEKSEKQAIVESAVMDLKKIYDNICIENELNGSVSQFDRDKQWSFLKSRDLVEETTWARKFSNKQDAVRVEALVHEELCAALKEKTIQTCEIDLAKALHDRALDFKRKELDIAMNYGSRITR